MKKINMYVASMVLFVLILACSSEKENMLADIKQTEDSLFADETKMIDRKLAGELVDKYVAYADAYPEDPQTPQILFKAGDLSMNMNMSRKAIQIFDRVMNNYPDYEKTPQCLFLKGYIYENDLKDLKTAKQIYEDFLDKYPDDEFADDAEISIKNLGKSPEELIREFEEKAKAEGAI
ncbi:MAG: tetratricopeptide repeat protein [Bacteroidales bacterium]|nr:tetratricopeptide repeat protein [Bacteroidales bacterium]